MEDRHGTPEAEVHKQRDALVDGLFERIIGAMEVATVYLGDRLGLYRALADGGPSTPAELAGRTGTHERYAREWLPSVPDVHERLRADPPARVADVGCGAGWSSISIARAYPKARVDGFDLDEPSVELARANAERAGLADRVSFHVRDASDAALEGRYDLATAFECIHDMGRPVEALRAMRRLVGEEGAVIVADERVADSFQAPGDDTERLMYGWSVLFCLPAGLADEPSVGTGTVMRQRTLRRYATEAGYRDVEVLPIENDLWCFYRLLP